MSCWQDSPYFKNVLYPDPRISNRDDIAWNYLLGKEIKWWDTGDTAASEPWVGRVQAINAVFFVALNFEGLIYVPWSQVRMVVCSEETDEAEKEDKS